MKKKLVLQQFFSFLSPTHKCTFWCEGCLSTRKSFTNNKQGHPLGGEQCQTWWLGRTEVVFPPTAWLQGEYPGCPPHTTYPMMIRWTTPSTQGPGGLARAHTACDCLTGCVCWAHLATRLLTAQALNWQGCRKWQCSHVQCRESVNTRQAQTNHHIVLKRLVEEQFQTAKLTCWAECSPDQVCFCPNCLEPFHQGRGKPQLPSQLSWELWELKETTHVLVHLSTVALLWIRHPTPVPVWTQPDQPWKFSFPLAESFLSVFLYQFITVCYWVHNTLTILLMTKVINHSPYILHSSSL